MRPLVGRNIVAYPSFISQVKCGNVVLDEAQSNVSMIQGAECNDHKLSVEL